VVGLDVLAEHRDPFLEIVDAILGPDQNAVDGDHAVGGKAGNQCT
jgi:hypothetical protein